MFYMRDIVSHGAMHFENVFTLFFISVTIVLLYF